MILSKQSGPVPSRYDAWNIYITLSEERFIGGEWMRKNPVEGSVHEMRRQTVSVEQSLGVERHDDYMGSSLGRGRRRIASLWHQYEGAPI